MYEHRRGNGASATRIRDFSDLPIDDDTLRALNEAVDAANADGGLDVQLVQDDTDAFGDA